MANSKSTKRALLTSALAILMCVAMLIGTTFAWFTDTASTAVNRIQAGNLKMEVTYANSATTTENDGEKVMEFKKLDENANVFMEGALWEPGHVEYVVLNVKNVGNLALKYKLGINIANETGSINVNGDAFKLSDYIRFAVIDGEAAVADRAALLNEATDSKLIKEGYSKESHLDTTGASETVTLAVWMPETVGNEANHAVDAAAPVIHLGINVVATQYTYEKDSFDDQYDKDATYPVRVDGTIQATGDTVLKDKPDDHFVKVTIPADSVDGVDRVSLLVVDSAAHPAVTVATTESSQSYEVTLKDQDNRTVQAADGSLFTVELFIGKNRNGVKLYHDGVEMTKDLAALQELADHFVYDSATGYITMKVSHFSPFTAVFAKDNWKDHAAESYATPVDEKNKVVTIATAGELALLAEQVNAGISYSGYTVKLTNDIDLAENMWEPIGKSGKTFQGTFDGNGHTIRHLLINEPGMSDVGLFGFTTNGEIKNFTLDTAEVTGYLDVGAVAGSPYTSKYTNIKLIGDVRVNGYAYVGGMLGKNAYANLTDLTIDVNAGSYVKANSENYRTYIGGLVGFMGEGAQVVKNVTSNIDVIGSTCDVGGITGIAHYGNTFINCHSSGDVTLLAAPDAGDELEIGGIAGVWHDQTSKTVTFTGCSYTGKLSSNNVKTGAVTAFENGGLVGRKYGSGTGTLIIN